MHRLFFALWPDDALRGEMAGRAQGLQAPGMGGRTVRPDRYHMTLQFLGDFGTPTAAMHASLLAAAAAVDAPAPFEMALDRIGSFGAGRVVWLGCGDAPVPLVRLHRNLAEALANAGIAPKREAGFVAHVTVLRNARAPAAGPIAPLRWRVADFVLIDATGGEYRRIGRWPLSPA